MKGRDKQSHPYMSPGERVFLVISGFFLGFFGVFSRVFLRFSRVFLGFLKKKWKTAW